MSKQKLMEWLVSRRGQIVFSAVFAGWNVVIGLLSTNPVWGNVAWALAGFLLCNLIHSVLRDWFLRADAAELQAHRARIEAGMREAAAFVKADMERWAAEHGLDLDIKIGPGEPPPRWKQ